MIRSNNKMTRRFVLITIFINFIVYGALLFLLSYAPSIVESKAQINLVPLAPILIAGWIIFSSNVSDFVFCLICLMISLNAVLSVIVSVFAKVGRRTFFWVHISLIIYWLWSILYLMMFK
jgi:hypothetical protein